MKNSERYFDNVRWFKADLDKINSEYDKAMQDAERFRGSEGYDDVVRRAAAKRDEAMKAAREQYGRAFKQIIEGMREKVGARTLTPPTQEQLSVLQALKMRSQVTADELRQAAPIMKGCPLALSVLEDIAQAGGHRTLRFGDGAMSTDYISSRIDLLEKSAYSLLNGESVNILRRTPTDIGDCLTRYAYIDYAAATDDRGSPGSVVDTAAVAKFCEAVD